jgi:Tfp pilus assembly protein PilX
MDSLITRILIVVVLVLLAVVGLQRVQVLKQRHTIDTMQRERDADAAIIAAMQRADSAITTVIEDERRRAETLQHDLDSLTKQLHRKHAPLPPRPVTAAGMRDAILRATATP